MRCTVIIFMLLSMVGCSCSHHQKTSQSISGAIDTVYNTVHDTIYDTLIIKDTIYQDMTIWSTECVFPNDMRSDLNDALQGDEWGFFDYNHSCYKPKGRFFWYAYDALTYIGAVLKHAEGMSLRCDAPSPIVAVMNHRILSRLTRIQRDSTRRLFVKICANLWLIF